MSRIALRMLPNGPPLCPSAQPDMAGATVFGVDLGTAAEPSVGYLEAPVPLTAPELQGAGPLSPTLYLRIAAQCEESQCVHFDGTDCGLATRVAKKLPKVVQALPKCAIRVDCRWFYQEGSDVCFRCPQVITESHRPSSDLARVAHPPETVAPDFATRGSPPPPTPTLRPFATVFTHPNFTRTHNG